MCRVAPKSLASSTAWRTASAAVPEPSVPTTTDENIGISSWPPRAILLVQLVLPAWPWRRGSVRTYGAGPQAASRARLGEVAPGPDPGDRPAPRRGVGWGQSARIRQRRDPLPLRRLVAGQRRL